jgi:hypothetical protein
MALVSADTSAEIKNITLDSFSENATSPSRHLVSCNQARSLKKRLGGGFFEQKE